MKAIKFRIICWVLSVVFSIISFRIKKVFPRGKFLYEPNWNLRVSMKRKIGNKSRGHKLIYIAMNCFYITFYMWQTIMAQKKKTLSEMPHIWTWKDFPSFRTQIKVNIIIYLASGVVYEQIARRHKHNGVTFPLSSLLLLRDPFHHHVRRMLFEYKNENDIRLVFLPLTIAPLYL